MWGAGGRFMSMRGSHMYGYECMFIFVFASRGGDEGGAFQLITLSFLLCYHTFTPFFFFFHFSFFLKGALHQSSLPSFKVKTILLIKHCVIATIISGFRQSKHSPTHLNLQWAPKTASTDRQRQGGGGKIKSQRKTSTTSTMAVVEISGLRGGNGKEK